MLCTHYKYLLFIYYHENINCVISNNYNTNFGIIGKQILHRITSQILSNPLWGKLFYSHLKKSVCCASIKCGSM